MLTGPSGPPPSRWLAPLPPPCPLEWCLERVLHEKAHLKKDLRDPWLTPTARPAVRSSQPGTHFRDGAAPAATVRLQSEESPPYSPQPLCGFGQGDAGVTATVALSSKRISLQVPLKMMQCELNVNRQIRKRKGVREPPRRSR